MIFKSRRAFEEALQRRFVEEEDRRMTYRRFDDLQTQIDKLRCELYDLRMATDPEFKRKNTPICNCKSDNLASLP